MSVPVSSTSGNIWLDSGWINAGVWTVFWSTSVEYWLGDTYWRTSCPNLDWWIRKYHLVLPLDGRLNLFAQVSRTHLLTSLPDDHVRSNTGYLLASCKELVCIVPVRKLNKMLTAKQPKTSWDLNVQTSESGWDNSVYWTSVKFWLAAALASVDMWLDFD